MKTLKDYEYYKTDTGILYKGDCREILPLLNCEVDLILTDPPYGISGDVKIKRGNTKFKGKDIVNNFGKWDIFKDTAQFMQFTYSWLDHAEKLLRPGGMFCSYFARDRINFLTNYLTGEYNGDHLAEKLIIDDIVEYKKNNNQDLALYLEGLLNRIIKFKKPKYKYKLKGYYADCKSNPVPQVRKVKWMNGWEMICLLQKPPFDKLTFNYKLGQEKDYGIRPIVGHTTKLDGDRDHPTQKPISVMMKFIRYWSNEGDTILDSFAGSGTTLIAAKLCNRKYIGIEQENGHCDTICRRMSEKIPIITMEGIL